MNQASESEKIPPPRQANKVIPLKKLEREALIRTLIIADYNIFRAAMMLDISGATF